jgi:ElaB/YqjD/DUF883 family membrane-anchored ribosome-binding protein
MRIKIHVLLAIILIFTAIPKSKCGWLGDMLGGFFGNVVDKATSGMIDHAKQAFRESMDYVFDNKIQPLIHQLEATADRVMDHAKDDINAVIDNFKKQMEELVETSAKIATEFVDHTVEEIKTKIIDNTFDKLNKFEDKLFQDMTTILNKIDEILKSVSCYAQAVIYRISDEIKKALPSLINPLEECRAILDKLFPGEWMRFKQVSSFSYSQLYEYRKCRLIHYLKEDSPIEAVKMAYRDLELLSGDMRCLSVALGAINNEKYYIKEMGEADFILDTLGSFHSYKNKNLK